MITDIFKTYSNFLYQGGPVVLILFFISIYLFVLIFAKFKHLFFDMHHIQDEYKQNLANIKNDDLYLLNITSLKSDYKGIVKKDFYIIHGLLDKMYLEHQPAEMLFSKEQVFKIENDVLGFHFPWYYIGKQTTYIPPENTPEKIRQGSYVNGPFLSHSLLRRTEEEHIKHTDRPTEDYSDGYAEFFFEIFHNWMNQNNKSYNNILHNYNKWK